MKRYLSFIGIIVFFLGCEDHSYDYGYDRYYTEIVTALERNVFQLDDGKTLYSKTEVNANRGDRLFLHYTLLDENNSGFDYTVRVNGAGSVLSRPLKVVSQNEMQSMKSEPIQFQSMWIGSHYLNMQFYMDYRSVAHSVALVVDERSLGESPLEIHFKHDSNNDPAGFPVHLYASFDLKEILGEPQQNKQIRIFVNTSNYGEKIYDLAY